MSFFKAQEIKAPKISLTLSVSRGEVTDAPVEVTFKIAKKIIEFTDAQITDEQLKAEVEKIAASS